MRIGVPREVKNHEYRVALTPAGAHELIARGARGRSSSRRRRSARSITDEDFVAAGARIIDDRRRGLGRRRPGAQGQGAGRAGVPPAADGPGAVHLPAPRRRPAVHRGRCWRPAPPSIAYETVQLPDGSLPLLAPMSEVAGRLAPQVGRLPPDAHRGWPRRAARRRARRAPAKVVVHRRRRRPARTPRDRRWAWAPTSRARPRRRPAARRSTRLPRRHPHDRRPTPSSIERGGASTPTWSSARCSSPARKAPKLVTNELVSRMKPGSVLVDIAIDQGGCFEDSRPTTHADPTFTVHGSVFYCVANMPGAVPHTSTYALTNVTLPYAVGARRQAAGSRRLARPRAGGRPHHARGRGDQPRRSPRRTTSPSCRSTWCWRDPDRYSNPTASPAQPPTRS